MAPGSYGLIFGAVNRINSGLFLGAILGSLGGGLLGVVAGLTIVALPWSLQVPSPARSWDGSSWRNTGEGRDRPLAQSWGSSAGSSSLPSGQDQTRGACGCPPGRDRRDDRRGRDVRPLDRMVVTAPGEADGVSSLICEFEQPRDPPTRPGSDQSRAGAPSSVASVSPGASTCATDLRWCLNAEITRRRRSFASDRSRIRAISGSSTSQRGDPDRLHSSRRRSPWRQNGTDLRVMAIAREDPGVRPLLGEGIDQDVDQALQARLVADDLDGFVRDRGA